jgi:glycosyltransferase involved in cell wall biosynthesis
VFSVVVPTLGRARQLEGCLDALAQLEYPPERYEVVVVNDGGGQAIDEATSRFADRLPLTVISTAAVGPSGARNAGIERAAGRFIAFTDDDCQPESGWLQALQPALEANPGAGIGGRTVNGARGRGAAASQTLLDATHAHFNRDPAAPTFFASCNLAFPADGIRAVGGFDEGFRHAEDRELCERWLRSGRRFAEAPEAVVRHMRELKLREFCRQQAGYGKGAWMLQRTRALRDGGSFRIEPGFYAELARRVRRGQQGAAPTSMAALALTSQIVYAVGFAHEALRARRRVRRQATPVGGVSR